MKLWLTKLRVSNALDSGKPLSDSLRRQIDASPELQDFARRTASLSSRLGKPGAHVPDLHEDIMRAVRAETRAERSTVPVWRWLAPAMVAAVVLVCLTVLRQPPAHSTAVSMDAPLAVLAMSENVPAALPSEMMAPLSKELARVNQDLVNTKNILAATVPFEFQ